jgi:PAS domain-containing protein
MEETQEELQESKQRYSALFNTKTNGIAHCRMIFDEQGRPVDYEILQINDAYEQITGIKRPDIREFYPTGR